MIESLKKITFNKEIGIIALFASLFLVYKFWLSADFSLTNTDNLFISQATLDGVDVSARITLFFNSILILGISIPLLYWGLLKLHDRFSRFASRSFNAVVLAGIGTLLILADVYGMKSGSAINIIGILFLFSFFFSFVFIQKNSVKGLVCQHVLPVIFLVGFLILTSLLFLLNSKAYFPKHPENVYFFILGVLMAVFVILKRIKPLFFRKYAVFLLPLAFIPVLIFLSIECAFYHKMKFNELISYKKLFIGMMAVSYVLFLGIIYFKKVRISTKSSLKYFFVPSAILSFILLTVYQPFIEQPTEIFELANNSNAMMKIFKFHQIPFVDFMSSHMLSEQFYGIIYSSIFGYQNDMGFYSYAFLYQVIFYFLIYFFALKIFKQPLLVFLFLVCFPYVSVLFPYDLFFSILAFFALRKLIIDQSVKKYVLLGFTLLFLIFWKLDVGAATLFAMVFFVPLTLFSERIKIEWKVVLKGTLILIGIIAIVSLFFIQIRSFDHLLSNIKNALHYTSANQAHGYTKLTNSVTHQFVNFHVLLPLIAVLASIFSVYFIRLKREFLSKQTVYCLSASLFLFLIYLANFQRGMVRHSFMENTEHFLNSSFYLALTLFILAFVQSKNTISRFLLFTFLGFGILVFVKYFPLDQEKSAFEKLVRENTWIGFDAKIQDSAIKGHVIENKIFAENNYLDLEKFFNKNLSKDQTFFDFSNTPMLYYYTGRNVPFYFCQNLQNTVDDYLQLEQMKELKAKDVPAVVYSNSPENWFDQTDGVPNAMRYYLLAEYIYTNYKPFEIINQHSIWVSKDKKFTAFSNKIDSTLSQYKTHDYKKAAVYIHDHFQTSSKLKLVETVHPTNSGDIKFDFFKISSKTGKAKHLFLKIYTKSAGHNKLDIQIMDGEKVIGVNKFQTLPGENGYMVRLTNHYLWHCSNPDGLKIRKRHNVEIIKLEFYLDER